MQNDLPYNLHKQKENSIEFNAVTDMVREALAAFDSRMEGFQKKQSEMAGTTAHSGEKAKMRHEQEESEWQQNPNCIMPY